MDAEVVHAIHSFVHHELHGEGGCFTGFKCHRTDGRRGGSTPLQYFNVGCLGKLEHLISNIGQLKGYFYSFP
jgi:hypothetical protein